MRSPFSLHIVVVFTNSNRTNNQTQTKDMATFTNPVPSPVPPTKGPKIERMLDLGVIEEDGEIDTDAELACDASGTSESPVATVPSNPVCTGSS